MVRPIISGAAVYDPAGLSLTGWWRASYAGSPWTPTASAGSSGSNGNLAEATNPPATGTAVNGLTPADFDGTNDQLSNATAMSTYLSDAAGSIVSLFYADAAGADVGATAYYGYDALFSDDTNGFLALTFTTAGVTLGCYNGATFDGLAVACGTGAWHLAQARWNATDIEVRIDSGAWSTLARTVSMAGADGIRVGTNYGQASFLDGKILETMTAQARLSDGNFDDLVSYVNDTYGLAL